LPFVEVSWEDKKMPKRDIALMLPLPVFPIGIMAPVPERFESIRGLLLFCGGIGLMTIAVIKLRKGDFKKQFERVTPQDQRRYRMVAVGSFFMGLIMMGFILGPGWLEGRETKAVAEQFLNMGKEAEAKFPSATPSNPLIVEAKVQFFTEGLAAIDAEGTRPEFRAAFEAYREAWNNGLKAYRERRPTFEFDRIMAESKAKMQEIYKEL
jgi:hypothetical protein